MINTINSVIKAPIIIILLLGLTNYIQQQLYLGWPLWNWMAFFTVMIFLIAWLKSDQIITFLNQNIKDKTVTIIYSVIITGIIAWALALNSIQTSDFGSYYRYGIIEGATKSPLEWLKACNGDFFCLRSLSLAPYSLLVGANYTAFKLLNAGLHLASIWLLYVIVHRWLGTVAAAVAAVFLAIHPERLFALTLATTDHTAIPAIIGVMAILAASSKSQQLWHSIKLGIALGILILIADIARTIGAMLILASGLFAILSIRQINAKFIWTTVLVGILSYTAIKYLVFGSSSLSLFNILSAIDLNTDQGFWTIVVWRDTFIPSIPNTEQYSVAFTKLLAELTNNLAKYPEYLAHKAMRLLSSVGYHDFGFLGRYGHNPQNYSTVEQSTSLSNPAFLYFPRAFSIVFYSLTTIGMFRSLRDDPLTLSALSLILIFFIITAMLGEAQPRYIALIAPALAIFAAHGLLIFSEIFSAEARNNLLESSFSIAINVATIITVFYVSIPILAWIGDIKYPGFMPFVVTDPINTDHFCQSSGTITERTFKRMFITFPSNTSCMRVSKSLDPKIKAVSFFVTWSPLSSSQDNLNLTSGISYQILLDNKVALEIKELSKKIQFHHIPIEPAKREISINVRANNSAATDKRGLYFWYWQEHK